jgi:hypothetical protein
VDQRATAADTDADGNILVASIRRRYGFKNLVLFKYSGSGSFLWDRVFEENANSSPVVVQTDRTGNGFIGGNVQSGSKTVARLWKYDSYGTYLWNRDYEGDGNCYVRQLQVDFTGNIVAAVEAFQGTDVQGQYDVLTLIFDTNGYRVLNR